MHFSSVIRATCPALARSFQNIRPNSRPCVTFFFYGDKSLFVSPLPNPEAGGPPLVGCPRLLIHYIRRCSPYLEAVSFIRNPRNRHAVVTGIHITWYSLVCW